MKLLAVGDHLFTKRATRVLLIAAPLLLVVSALIMPAPIGTKLVVSGLGLLAALLFKLLAEMSVHQRKSEYRLTNVDSKHNRDLGQLRIEATALREGIERSKLDQADLIKSISDVSHEVNILEEAMTDAQRRVERVTAETASLRSSIADFETTTKDRLGSIDKSSKRQADIIDSRLKPDVDMLLGRRHQQLPRSLDDEQRGTLLSWAPQLGFDLEPEVLDYWARKAITVEAAGTGRLAASTADAVFRVLVANSISPPEAHLLEIGVLFGLNASLVWETVGIHRPGFHQTLIDPFDGYYGTELDRFTGLKVTQSITESNLRRVGAPEDSWRILAGYSTSDSIIQQAGETTYDLIFVDGDHSYDGIRNDVTHFAPFLRQGGLLMIDDYGAPAWPGVTKFIDEVLADDEAYRWIGNFNRTALFARR